jgi:alkylated DNA repair protein alkB family protein 8
MADPAADQPQQQQQQQQQQQRQPPPLAAHRSPADLAIPGLALLPGFVSAEEEAALLAHLDEDDDTSGGDAWQALARRRVRHYGAAFDYATRGVVGAGATTGDEAAATAAATTTTPSSAPPLPEWAAELAARVEDALIELGLLPEAAATADAAAPDDDAETAPPRRRRPRFFNQITANEYSPGVGLAPHVDTHSAFYGPILSLSLAGPCVIEMRRYGQRPKQPQQKAPARQGRPGALALPPRSLLVLSGEARLGWHHYIPHRKSDAVYLEADNASTKTDLVPRAARRVSLTFRRVRSAPGDPPRCACAWPECCDDQGGGMPPTRAQEREAAAAAAAKDQSDDDADDASADRAAAELERRHVHQVYDAISAHFDSTRFAVWPAVARFLDSLSPGAVVADVGCGNGKYMAVRRDLAVLGCDRSARLAEAATRWRAGSSSGGAPAEAAGKSPEENGAGIEEKGPGKEEGGLALAALAPAPLPAPPPGSDALVADCLALPYAPERCDAVLCVAVLHHVASERRRRAAVREMARALRVGGRALVTVWAREQQDPGRTLRRWVPLAAGGGAAGTEEGAGSPPPGDGGADGGDYLVPWHLPLAKKSAAEAVAAAAGAGEGDAEGAPPPAPAPPLAGVPPELAAPRVDPGKRSVVYGRYYHLFGAGELEALVEAAVGGRGAGGAAESGGGESGGGGDGGSRTSPSARRRPRCVVVDSLFDKSNWCVTFERVE